MDRVALNTSSELVITIIDPSAEQIRLDDHWTISIKDNYQTDMNTSVSWPTVTSAETLI